MGQQATVQPRDDSRLSSARYPEFGRQDTNGSAYDEHDDVPYEPYRRAGGAHSADHPSMFDFSTEDKAQELCGILKALETQLENPTDFGVIGRTYRRLAEWTWEHRQDGDFLQVLEMLAPDHMYPAWRRQALEEAYMLFFEDCAKQGNPKALEQLPEPPTSKEIGYRPLPEGLLDPKTTRGAAFTNTYEAGNPCCIRRRWDYEVVRNGPRPRPGERKTVGRKIVAKDSQQRYCACAVDPMTRLMQVLLPESMCCGRERKVPADSAGTDDSHKAHSHKPRTAAAPLSSAPFKSKPGSDFGSGFPVPPQTPRDDSVPYGGRVKPADQSTFARDNDARSMSARPSSVTV